VKPSVKGGTSAEPHPSPSPANLITMASLEGAVLMTPSPGEPEVERKLSRREEVQKKRVTEVAASMYAGAAEQMQGGGASGDGGGGGLAAAGVGDGKKETPVAEEDSVDPRSLSSWPPLSAGSAGQQKVHSAAGGPLTIAFQECMPIRAKTALVSSILKKVRKRGVPWVGGRAGGWRNEGCVARGCCCCCRRCCCY
jgi:hypothetical protein